MAMEQFTHVDQADGLVVKGRHEAGGRVIIDSITRVLGTPDPDLITGDWDGSKTQALAYRSLITNLRVMHTRYTGLRAQWSGSTAEGAAARAVAYQSVVMDLNRLITDAERIASGLL